VTAAFDSELFGHWWLEGPTFVGHLLALLARHPTIRAVTLDEALAELSPREHADIARGTWGLGGDYRSWITPSTEDPWDAIARREAETLRLVAAHQGPVADQLLREQLLLASSDFTWMIGLDRNAQYGRERIEAHVERWDRLAATLATGGGDEVAAEIHEIDNPFPDLSAARRAIASSLPAFGRV
jgi:1,4-alpha-glucan branching enzyme